MSVFSFTALFNLLLFLTIGGTLCGHVFANGVMPPSTVPKDTVELFQTGKINIDFQTNEKTPKLETIQVKDYYSPVLVSTHNVIVALAEVNCATESDKKISVLTKHIVTKSETEWEKKILDSSSSGGWKNQLAAQKDIQSRDNTSFAKAFFAVAKNEKIYLLLVNCSNKEDSDEPTQTGCEFEIVVGTVDSNAESDKTVTWEKLVSPFISNDKTFNLQLKKNLLCQNSIFGTAFLNDEKIIFLLEAKVKEKTDVIAFVREQETDEKFEVVPVSGPSENCHFFVFPWNKSIIKHAPDCEKSGQTKIKKLTSLGNAWEEDQVPFSSLSAFLVGKQHFTTLIIDDKELLFFTQKFKEEVVSGKKENTYLWISDGNRATKVGEIFVNSESTAPLSFLYHKEKLFLFAQNCEGGTTKKICLTRLDVHVKKVKSVLSVWKPNKNIHVPCTDVAQFAISCSTDGLVGFLSDTPSNDLINWQDKFYYINAKVTNGTKARNGFTFKEKGAGAIWLVGKQSNDQPYDFITSGFTLVATVKIENNDKEKGNSLLGMVLNEEGDNRIGLWCSGGKKWAVKIEKNAPLKESQKECAKEKTYILTLVLENDKTLRVHVDGEKLTFLDTSEITVTTSQNIKHFYFAAEKDESTAKTDVTIENVLLYNTPFSTEEIEVLKPKQNAVANNEKQNQNEGSKLPKPAESAGTTETDNFSSNTSPTKNEQDVQSSPPPTTEDSAVRVGVVGVLCFMLFGVFTLLGRYVY